MDLKDVYTGLKASIIASSCCTLPLILALLFSVLGLGSVTAAFKIPRYKWFFIAAGALFMLTSLYLKIRKECGGTCSIEDVKQHRMTVIVTITTYVVLTYTIINLLLPVISARIFT